jgi:hypothetical protein
MRPARLVLLPLMAALLAGAASPVLAAKAPVVIVADDKFSKEATLSGPAGFKNPFAGTSRTWFLRSFVDKATHQVTHQLYVDIGYVGSWRWYEAAADDSATGLPVQKVSSQVGGCGGFGGCILDEVVVVAIPGETLATRRATGFEVKLAAKSGDSLVLPITSQMISLQLQAVDGYVTAAPPAPAEPK